LFWKTWRVTGETKPLPMVVLPQTEIVERNTFIELRENSSSDSEKVNRAMIRQSSDSILECIKTTSHGTDLVNSSTSFMGTNTSTLKASSRTWYEQSHGATDSDSEATAPPKSDTSQSGKEMYEDVAKRIDSVSDLSEEHSERKAFAESTPENESQQEVRRMNPEIEAARRIAQAGGGLCGCTTVMVQNVPREFTTNRWVKEIDRAGFHGQYDFMYLPMRNNLNRGFAFVNFISADIAERFYLKFHGHMALQTKAEKPFAVMPADVQGFQQNMVHYTMKGKLKKHSKPLFARPMHSFGNSYAMEFPVVQQSQVPICLVPCIVSSEYMDPYTMAVWPTAQMTVLQPSGPCANAATNVVTYPRFCSSCGNSRDPAHKFCPFCAAGFH